MTVKLGRRGRPYVFVVMAHRTRFWMIYLYALPGRRTLMFGVLGRRAHLGVVRRTSGW